jgi:VIT1/CCC1 family predicted Fe2+/Mn2+ transporter
MMETFSEQSHRAKLNWLRAGVLGANDGIVSIAGLVVGVAGATTSSTVIATAGIAGLVAGALSMAVGEYISVSTQRDAERAYIKKEERDLKEDPEGALKELTEAYIKRGLKEETAKTVAHELTENNALAAHLEVQFGLEEDDLTNPWHAALASAISFTLGGLIPILAVLLPHQNWRIPVAFMAVIPALALTGYVSAKLSDANPERAVIRVVFGGWVAMIITYAIGSFFHITGL